MVGLHEHCFVAAPRDSILGLPDFEGTNKLGASFETTGGRRLVLFSFFFFFLVFLVLYFHSFVLIRLAFYQTGTLSGILTETC